MAMFTDAALASGLFVTLTYPATFPDAEQAKEHLRALEARIQRKYGKECCGYEEYADAAGRKRRRKLWREVKVGIIWRLEFQERGAPHFHLIVLGVPYMAHQWLSQAWYEVVGSGDPGHLKAGVEVRKVRDSMHARRYLDKYLAKVDQAGGGESIGRSWGMVGAWREFLAEAVMILAQPEELARAVRFIERRRAAQERERRRVARRKYGAAAGSAKRRRKRWAMTRARRVYTSDGEGVPVGRESVVWLDRETGETGIIEGQAFERVELQPVNRGFWFTDVALLLDNWAGIVNYR